MTEKQKRKAIEIMQKRTAELLAQGPQACRDYLNKLLEGNPGRAGDRLESDSE